MYVGLLCIAPLEVCHIRFAADKIAAERLVLMQAGSQAGDLKPSKVGEVVLYRPHTARSKVVQGDLLQPSCQAVLVRLLQPARHMRQLLHQLHSHACAITCTQSCQSTIKVKVSRPSQPRLLHTPLAAGLMRCSDVQLLHASNLCLPTESVCMQAHMQKRYRGDDQADIPLGF